MARRGGKKSPSREVDSNREKSPKTADIIRRSFQKERIRWSFSILDMEGPFGWSKCSISSLKRLKQSLTNLETMTWADIENRRNHTIPKEKLSNTAKKRLIQIGMDDIQNVFSLRIGGKERIIGIRYRDVFRFLWWDPNHEVCPSTFGK